MELEKGKYLVRTARKAVEEFVKSGNKHKPSSVPAEFTKKSGVFTTLHTYPGKELRGCIGYPEPVMPLIEALIESAVSATRDPRFPPLTESELDNIIVEVSVLSPPEEIKANSPNDYPKHVKIGRDGLIIEKGYYSGLLLPQVPVEWGWDAREFLDNLCMKAGLPPGSWRSGDVRISRFSGEIFAEKSPRGKVAKEKI